MDGSNAVIGKDVYETFSPVVDHFTVRLLVSFAFANRWKIKHWDISLEVFLAFSRSRNEMLYRI